MMGAAAAAVQAARAILRVPADGIPTPKPSAPPGGVTGKVSTMLGWGSWIVMAVCGVAVLACAARMAMAHRSGADGGANLVGLGWIIAAAILVGSGAAAINSLVS